MEIKCYISGGKVSKVLKIILKSINYLIITMVVILAILMVGVKIFGVQIYTVLSGSMEPTYKVGSLVYVVDTDINELTKGDVITFRVTENVIATHRIVEIDEGISERKFRTKGDANDFVDENFVEKDRIIGKPVFTIPYLGYVASFMQTISGKLIMVGVSILLIVVVVVIDSITDDKKKI